MNIHPHFYSYGGLNVETYDAREAHMLGRTTVEGDTEWYVERARTCGGPVLEGACGTGRVAWAIAAAGIEVVGFDLNETMLSVARGKRRAMGKEVSDRAEFLQGDLRTFDLGRRFPLAIIPFRSFQALLTPEDQMESLRRLRDHLEDDGRLILNLFDPKLEYLLEGADQTSGERARFTHPDTGSEVVIEVGLRVNDPFQQCFTETWTFVEFDVDGNAMRHEQEQLTMRWSYRWEMRHLFARTGLEVVEEFGDFKGGGPAYGREQVWVLRKA
ncbi:MAG: class I SAM-dependent methyltransferase [Planctomycetota bacterium]